MCNQFTYTYVQVFGFELKYDLIVLQDVAVLGEAELMAVMVMSKRKFQLIHGGVVRTADVLGERKGTYDFYKMNYCFVFSK